MKQKIWDAKEAEKATGGKSTSDWVSSGISIDSRTIKDGELFVALKGENSDGHQYVSGAFRNGAGAAVVDHIPKEVGKDKPLLVVKDVQKALEDLASYRRKHTQAKIISITGSVGKTSVKEGVAMVLSSIDKTHSTAGNFNNHIGMPISMANMPVETKYGVFELGMNHAGELSSLSKLLNPDVALITTVTAMHLEFFKSVADIARAKAEIMDGLSKDGVVVLPFDNEHFQILKDVAISKKIKNIITFGRKKGADIQLCSEEVFNDGQNLEVKHKNNSIHYTIKAYGRHQALNSVAILAAIIAAGVDVSKCITALKSYDSQPGRGKVVDIKFRGKKIKLIDDSYNAGPDSMRAAFEVLSLVKKNSRGRAVALLGDMLELGDDSSKIHASLSKDVVSAGIDVVFTSGSRMEDLANALPKNKLAGRSKNPEELMKLFESKVEDGDIVLIKGSHGSNMWKIVEAML